MPVVEVTNLHKRYGDTVAVHDVSFTVEEGEIFGILGPNGAGKTTTVECVEGMRRPDGGAVSVFGYDPQQDRQHVRELVGAQLQDSQLPDKLTVWEAVDLYASFYAAPADPAELLDRLGLAAKRRVQFRRLSGGQKQRLSVALALVGNPRLAVLDELTAGLDPHARRDVWSLVEEIRASGVTILLVTHFMEEAERLCDRVAVVDAGRIVALDTPAALTSRVDDEQRITFRTAEPLDEQVLADLPEVATVRRSDRQLVVTGTGNVLHAVTSVLARHGVIAQQLRVDQATLDDAFVALTGRSLGTGTDEEN